MAYATLDDLITEFGDVEINRLADKNGDGEPDTGVIESAMAFAEAKINALVGDRIQFIATDPTQIAALKFVALDIIRWRLHGTRVTDEVKSRYDDALGTLKAIRQGTEGLGKTGDPTSLTAPLDSTIQINTPDISTRWGGGAF